MALRVYICIAEYHIGRKHLEHLPHDIGLKQNYTSRMQASGEQRRVLHRRPRICMPDHYVCTSRVYICIAEYRIGRNFVVVEIIIEHISRYKLKNKRKYIVHTVTGELVPRTGIQLVACACPGHQEWDEDLVTACSVPVAELKTVFSYLMRGGFDNFRNLFLFLSDT